MYKLQRNMGERISLVRFFTKANVLVRIQYITPPGFDYLLFCRARLLLQLYITNRVVLIDYITKRF